MDGRLKQKMEEIQHSGNTQLPLHQMDVMSLPKEMKRDSSE
jgi:hypothetical protein